MVPTQPAPDQRRAAVPFGGQSVPPARADHEDTGPAAADLSAGAASEPGDAARAGRAAADGPTPGSRGSAVHAPGQPDPDRTGIPPAGRAAVTPGDQPGPPGGGAGEDAGRPAAE